MMFTLIAPEDGVEILDLLPWELDWAIGDSNRLPWLAALPWLLVRDVMLDLPCERDAPIWCQWQWKKQPTLEDEHCIYEKQYYTY